MKQILVIHGGTTFPSYEAYLEDLKASAPSYDRILAYRDWKSNLKNYFPNDDVLLPSFPNKQNAQYEEWSIVFEKILPFLTSEVVLIGHSLGAIFLAKYLHEHPLTQKVSKLILVAAPYCDESLESLGDFKLESASGLEDSANEVHLFFSKDDPIVSIDEMAHFQRDLPNATFHVLDGRYHFWQSEFPEIVELINK